jgi:hypothetical protein
MSVLAVIFLGQQTPLTLPPYLSNVLVSKHDVLTNAICDSAQNFLQVKKIVAYKEFSEVLHARLPFTTISITDAIRAKTF